MPRLNSVGYLSTVSGRELYFRVRERAPTLYRMAITKPPAGYRWYPKRDGKVGYCAPPALEAWEEANGRQLRWKAEGSKGWWIYKNIRLRALSSNRWDVIRPIKGGQVFYVPKGARGVTPAIRVEGGLEGWGWVAPNGRGGQFFRTQKGAERCRAAFLLA